jgi:outer membrane protein OmpA-like peptidoglycan-associated protein
MLIRICLLLLCLSWPGAAWAQADAEGAKDHPVVPRLAGGQYYISDYEARDFGTHDFYVADDSKDVEGRYTRIEYWIKDGGKPFSGIEIGRNYQKAVADKKGETLHFDLSNGGGSATFRLALDGARLWIALDVSNGGEVYELTIVEETVMVQNVALNAGALAEALVKDGKAVIHGVLFDTGKSTIKAESAAQLQAIADLMKLDPSLRLEIVGHTDNTGTPAANLTLSQQRADSVRTWLVSNGGVATERLTASGKGDTQPVADNSTEDGRAKNRRVELIRR